MKAPTQKDKEAWLAGQDFSTDSTTAHIPVWVELLRPLRNRELDVLEVGAGEGRSATFFLRLLPRARLTAVDSFWAAEAAARFDANLRGFADRVEVIRKLSVDALHGLIWEGRRFDLIHLDGTRERDLVMVDSVLAWKLLQVGGLLVWSGYREGRGWPDEWRPKTGIDLFLRMQGGACKVLRRGDQVIVRRTADRMPQPGSEPARPPRVPRRLRLFPAAAKRPVPVWGATGSSAATWGECLSVSPLIIHTLPSIGVPLGAASALGPRLRRRFVHFLMMPSGTLEDSESVERLVRAGKAYLAAHRRHRMTFVCNTEVQTERIVAAGLEAITINQNCLMDDAVFRPLPGVTPVYDCVYNARLSPEKRHELALAIDKLALIYFYDATSESVAAFHATHARFKAMFPQAWFVNKLTPAGCDWLGGSEINHILAQSRVGLCLSRAEGAMRVAIEYLFAGLPVVETPTVGGRDYFFDKEFCVTVEPDPRSVRDAVDALIARNIPRDHIRAKTLAKVEAERRRYISFVQEIIDRAGGDEQFESRFWRLTRGKSIVNWQRMEEFHAGIERELRAREALGRRARRRW